MRRGFVRYFDDGDSPCACRVSNRADNDCHTLVGQSEPIRAMSLHDFPFGGRHILRECRSGRSQLEQVVAHGNHATGFVEPTWRRRFWGVVWRLPAVAYRDPLLWLVWLACIPAHGR